MILNFFASNELSIIDLAMNIPMLIVVLGALVMMALDICFKGEWPRAFVAGIFICFALIWSIVFIDESSGQLSTFFGFIKNDALNNYFTILILIGVLITLFLGSGMLSREGIKVKGEYYTLLLMATFGALLFASTQELITFFIALETMSLAVYCMCGLALERKASAESALKYFLMGSFSSAFLLYGIALLYGLTGSTLIPVIASELPQHFDSPVLLLSVGLMLVGLGFKIGAVPFHFWTPDVYQGAPTPVTGFMASIVKAAAVAASIRVFWGLFSSPEFMPIWSDALWLLAVLTMTLGNLAALRQRSVKRMLAYSSIAHAGYMLIGLLVPEHGGGGAVLYYMAAYTAMTLGSFGLVAVVASGSTSKDGEGADDISAFHGLGFKKPLLGILMTVFMFSLAGLPPGLGGLLGKFYLFNAAVKGQFIGLAIIGVINSAISCYYYLRILVAMYFIDAPEDAPELPRLNIPVRIGLITCAVASIAIGLMPTTVYEFASYAVSSF